MSSLLFALTFIIIGLSASLPVSGSTSSSSASKFDIAVLNDVHLELLYDPYGAPEDACRPNSSRSTIFAPFGRHGCDSPLSLFTPTLAKMRSVLPHPNLILIPGDLVSHTVPTGRKGSFDPVRYERLKETISTYTRGIAATFPGVPIVFTPGNDDYVINYNVPDVAHKADYYQFMYQRWVKDILANNIAVYSSIARA
ncbi:MAG: metallophosphoesterase [Candidatus Pacebacteria bacterium]|nr:metallophosphoesterase [Candidatus Paceibacterota bacterium]